MKDYIQIGIDKGHISLNEDRSRMEMAAYVYYLRQRAKTLQGDANTFLTMPNRKWSR